MDRTNVFADTEFDLAGKDMGHNLVYQGLLDYLEKLDQAVVAFSGGVDSSLLLYTAHQALKDKAIAITIRTPYIPAVGNGRGSVICPAAHDLP